MPRNPDCVRCSLNETCNIVCLWGEGPKRCDIMLVGEAPGATEDNVGKPFQGDAGELLNQCLDRAGIDRDSVYITNVVKCRPPGNRDPSPAELGACLPYLIEEIGKVKPKVIICVGRWALKVLTGQDAITRARGKLLDPLPKLRLGNVKLIAMTHPAAYLHQGRNPAVLDGIVEDLKYTFNIISPTAVDAERYLLDNVDSADIDMVKAALWRLRNARLLACDLEWIANKDYVPWPWSPGTEALSISLTGRVDEKLVTVALAIPHLGEDGMRLLRSLLKTRGLIFHNAMADVIWLLSLGIEPSVKGDSMLLAYLVDEQRRAGLKGLAPLVAGVESGWESPLWYFRPTSRQGWLECLTYNAGDTEGTLRLHDALIAQVAEIADKERVANIMRVYTTLLLPAVKPFARAALNGVPIDEKKLAAAIYAHSLIRKLEIDRLAKITGLRTDKAEKLAHRPAQIVRYARESYGLQIDTSGAEDLSDYVESYPALAAIQTIKHEHKMLSTYLEPWQRLVTRQGDGRLHSVYLLGATRTGRLSAEIEEGGSLLLTPRDFWMRDLIAATDDDWEITAADYSQLELRLIAWLAPERTMRRLDAEGADLHSMTAAYNKVGGDIKDFWRYRKQHTLNVTKDERQAGKSNNFGFVFLMQVPRYIAYAKKAYGIVMSERKAEQQRDGFFKLYSDLAPWHQRAMRDFEQKGYTLTPFGRYRFGLTDAAQAINTPIQTTGADLTILASTIIDEILQQGLQDDAEFIGFVHDAVLVYNRKSVHDEVREIIRNAMENPALDRVGVEPIPVPLVADIKSGSSWARAE